MNAPPVTDELPISLRAYAIPEKQVGKKARKQAAHNQIPASEWTLIFDCETTTDHAQSLRFGTYQIRQNGALMEGGLFYDPENLRGKEINLLRKYADDHGVFLLTRAEFVEDIFYKIGFEYRATIVGFNLPFDISRIAIGYDSARQGMKGGFTFKLSDDKRWPNVQIKHLSAKAAFIQFAAPFKSRSNRSQRKKGIKQPIRRGHFIDCKTLSHALFAKSFSLSSLCEALSIENQKLDFDDFDGPLTSEFIDYAMRDTQTTWECYNALIDKYGSLNLTETPPEKIYSEASIGKACLKAMRVKPWQQAQPDFAPQLIGNIMSAYYGGRSEIGIRREHRQVMLCDFLSMYPTVCTLMQLWRYVIATGIETRDATNEAWSILDRITLEKLQSKGFWRKLVILVRVKSEGDIFPARAQYGDAKQATIGLNFMTNDKGQWFTLADCIASKLLTGKTPKIISAIGYKPKRKQRGLEETEISGNADYTINPSQDDFYKRLIELRQSTKAKLEAAKEVDKAKLDMEQNALKILANATSYGIFVELNVEDGKAANALKVFNGRGDPYNIQSSKIERPGSYFHPLLATLITGAARLMLAVTETLAANRGLDWAFCDTDSMALAKPYNMDAQVFADKVHEIVDWFRPLNPYDFAGSILKSEDVNCGLETGSNLEPLYCFAVSAKRYALYNLDKDGRPIIRKASAHGLGHLRPPYDKSNPASEIPAPLLDLSKSGIALWQHDLWYKIIEAGLSEKPTQIDLDYHPMLKQPAVSRYAATSPALLRWFKTFNANRGYNNQVKPFGFMTALFSNFINADAKPFKPKTGRPKKKIPMKPISPYETNPAKAAELAFDRNTGKAVSHRLLKSYHQSIAQYHLQPENKFLNGDYIDRGRTQRRHIKAASVSNIGKEANDWERQAVLGYDQSAQPAYGYCPADLGKLQAELTRLCDVFSISQIAQLGGVTPKIIVDFIAPDCSYGIEIRNAGAMESLISAFRQMESRKKAELDNLRQQIEKVGLSEVARKFGTDKSNLRRLLSKSNVLDRCSRANSSGNLL